MNVFGNPQLAQVLLWIYSHDAHFSQQPSYSFRPNQNAKPPYKIYHTQYPFGRTFQKLFIHTSHQFQIFWIFWYRLIIHVAPIYIQKLTLPANTDSPLGIYHFFEGFSIPNCSDTRLQNNRARESRSQTCLDYAERRRLKVKPNPLLPPIARSFHTRPFPVLQLLHQVLWWKRSLIPGK